MKLTTRQLATYKLIEENSKLGKVTTQEEIYRNFPEETKPYGYKWTNGTHDHCVAIWQDIEAINFNQSVERLIITKDFEYWLARNEEEAVKFANHYKLQACRKFSRYWNVMKKVSKNGQGKIDFTNELMENMKTEFINTYGKEDN